MPVCGDMRPREVLAAQNNALIVQNVPRRTMQKTGARRTVAPKLSARKRGHYFETVLKDHSTRHPAAENEAPDAMKPTNRYCTRGVKFCGQSEHPSFLIFETSFQKWRFE